MKSLYRSVPCWPTQTRKGQDRGVHQTCKQQGGQREHPGLLPGLQHCHRVPALLGGTVRHTTCHPTATHARRTSQHARGRARTRGRRDEQTQGRTDARTCGQTRAVTGTGQPQHRAVSPQQAAKRPTLQPGNRPRAGSPSSPSTHGVLAWGSMGSQRLTAAVASIGVGMGSSGTAFSGMVSGDAAAASPSVSSAAPPAQGSATGSRDGSGISPFGVDAETSPEEATAGSGGGATSFFASSRALGRLSSRVGRPAAPEGSGSTGWACPAG
mmetsp:Transcript_264/g.908  ORF Transcript_264/g.908 Transcript_264/m.908 type:complete len:269 (-) Transcript_264:111-917(-)